MNWYKKASNNFLKEPDNLREVIDEVYSMVYDYAGKKYNYDSGENKFDIDRTQKEAETTIGEIKLHNPYLNIIVPVTIYAFMDFDKGVAGSAYTDIYHKIEENSSYVNINVAYINNYDEVKRTIYHELIHIVDPQYSNKKSTNDQTHNQYLFDPREYNVRINELQNDIIDYIENNPYESPPYDTINELLDFVRNGNIENVVDDVSMNNEGDFQHYLQDADIKKKISVQIAKFLLSLLERY